MKKLAIAFVCMIMATGAATAQKTFTWGPKVGFDITHFWGKDIRHGIQPNYQAGLFFEYRVADKFAIAPEVVFATQGGKQSLVLDLGSLGKFDYTETYHTNYVNVPVMFKFYPTSDFSIDFGPQVGFNVYSKCTDKYEFNGKEVVGYEKDKKVTDLKDGTKTVDFGVALGATYNLSENAFIQARYTLGVTKVFKGNADIHNGNGQIAFGYRF